MGQKLFSYEIKEKSLRFLNCETINDLSKLGINTNLIQLLGLNPPYYTFEVRKSNGKMRIIEAPENNLKDIQKQLNFYLQCVYWNIKSPVSFGYVIAAKDIKTRRNILQNAKSHLGNKFMLKVDFKDFFHQIKSAKILNLLQNPPFRFNKKAANILTRIFTYKKRLPMGAPSSPALSNLALIGFDNELYNWAKTKNIVFTRFVDDLSFSSNKVIISNVELGEITHICKKYNLELNPFKTKFINEFDLKEVTGLMLNETVDISNEFYEELDNDMDRIRKVAETNIIIDKHNHDSLLRDFKKEIEGKINFIGMIEGYDSEIFFKYRKKLKNALNPNKDALFSRWTNFNYF